MSDTILHQVQESYGRAARSGLSSESSGIRAVAEAFGYSAEELAAAPAMANLGLSCGNPTALADLRDGETVVDLGCGGGLDVFLAAARVGPTGKAIGIDMTAEMIALARRNAAARHHLQEHGRVEFHLATIDRLPLPDNSVDCVISNCVLNLVPDKPAAFREIARVLRPGGRLAASDIALRQHLPEEIKQSLSAYIGCVAGAILIEEYRRLLREGGFATVRIVDSGADLNAYSLAGNQSGCCSPAMSAREGLPVVSLEKPTASGAETPTTLHGQLADLLGRYDVNKFAASVGVFAVKPVL